MEHLFLDQGAAWSVIAPMIQSRQREIAARTAETAAISETQTAAPLQSPQTERPVRDTSASDSADTQNGQAKSDRAPGELSDAEQQVVDEMRARDAEVRRHEEAHARVGGQYASSPSYTFQTGPDGKNYAIGGEVQIDVAPVDGDPEATIDKMDIVKAAALAPAEPSAADRAVASLADRQRGAALAELNRMRLDGATGQGALLDQRV